MKLATRIRNAARALIGRGYDAASGSARWPAWASMWAPARQQLQARHQIASRAGYLIANSPTAASIVEKFTSHLIGDGPIVRSAHPIEAVRRALDEAWSRFVESCDHEGVDSFDALLCRLTRSLIGAGESLVHLVTSDRGELRLRLLSPEQLDPAMTREIENMTRIISGVEFDASGRRIAFHIYREQPDLVVTMLGPPVRIAADDIIHLFESLTPGQVRGTSWLSPVLTNIIELDQLEDAMLARAKTSALFSGFITDPEGTSGFVQGTRDPSELSLEPGSLRQLPPGASVVFPQMPDSNGQSDFVRHNLRQIAAGVGMPFELVASDLSTVNYSSARMGMESFRRRCKAVQATLLTARVIRPIWQRHVLLEVLSGRLYAPAFERNPTPYFAMTARFPEWASLDPRKDAQADVLELNAGLRSRAEIIAARGRDIADVDREIEADPLRPDVAALAQNLLLQPPEAANAA